MGAIGVDGTTGVCSPTDVDGIGITGGGIGVTGGGLGISGGGSTGWTGTVGECGWELCPMVRPVRDDKTLR